MSASLLAAGLLAGGAALAQQGGAPPAGPAASSAGFSAGLSAHGRTTEADIGLPAYPGAVPQREPGSESAGASLGLWGGPLGVQLHVLKLRSADPVDTVARFYRSALARHGEVLDCPARGADEPRGAPPAESRSERRGEDKSSKVDKSDKTLRCGSDHAKPGGRLLKAGLPTRVRMVSMEPAEGGTLIQLVRLELRGD